MVLSLSLSLLLLTKNLAESIEQHSQRQCQSVSLSVSLYISQSVCTDFLSADLYGSEASQTNNAHSQPRPSSIRAGREIMIGRNRITAQTNSLYGSVSPPGRLIESDSEPHDETVLHHQQARRRGGKERNGPCLLVRQNMSPFLSSSSDSSQKTTRTTTQESNCSNGRVPMTQQPNMRLHHLSFFFPSVRSWSCIGTRTVHQHGLTHW